MANSKPMTLPLIPLAHNSVVLPGGTLRIPVTNRGDIAVVLAHIYSRATTPQVDAAVTLGCVPLASPLLGRDGEKLIEDKVAPPVLIQEDMDPSMATNDDLFRYGCVAKVSGMQGRRQRDLALIVEGIGRITVNKITKEKPFFEAETGLCQEETINPTDAVIQKLFNNLKQLSREFLALVRLSSLLPSRPSLVLSPILAHRVELFISRKNIEEAGTLADFMANLVESSHEEKLRILAALSIKDRMELMIEITQRQISNLQGNGRIMTIRGPVTITRETIQSPATNLDKLRTKMLMRRMGVGSPPNGVFGSFPPGTEQGNQELSELDELKKRLDEAKMPLDAQKVAQRELQRLQKMNPIQAEYQVCRNYLETLAEIPWSKTTEDHFEGDTLAHAKKQLDDDHYGLEKIKKRLLEYLAVLKLKQQANADIDAQIKRLEEQTMAVKKKQGTSTPTDAELRLRDTKRMVDKSPILLLVGPPGTGKTSLAKSIATALGRKFHRISLGGVRDEAEIRGHRRTYVAAMPGLIINGLRKVGVVNPVFLLDEIDKIGMSNFHGDPSAALLEVLDPEQNYTFTDHYINIPIDLSRVLFVATANTLDTIPPPLLDRMETIQLSGYTTLEKRHIAAQHLVPKQITSNGLSPGKVQLAGDVLDRIITAYTRESGVRNLEREIGSVCRFKAVEYASASDEKKLNDYDPVVTIQDLDTILGVERFPEELAERSLKPGVVTGLVAYSSGGQGSILFIEVADMPGNGRVQLTGKLGDVLKESVEVALTWVKAHAFELGLSHDPTEDIMKNRNVHIHCPSGAIPKDGPSAGLAHTIALISLFSSRPVPPAVAVTGEVSLRGRVLPVGGIKEKLIGALRAGVEKVLLPEGNRKDIRDLPEEVVAGLKIVHVGYLWEALREVWPDGRWPGDREWASVESRL